MRPRRWSVSPSIAAAPLVCRPSGSGAGGRKRRRGRILASLSFPRRSARRPIRTLRRPPSDRSSAVRPIRARRSSVVSVPGSAPPLGRWPSDVGLPVDPGPRNSSGRSRTPAPATPDNGERSGRRSCPRVEAGRPPTTSGASHGPGSSQNPRSEVDSSGGTPRSTVRIPARRGSDGLLLSPQGLAVSLAGMRPSLARRAGMRSTGACQARAVVNPPS